jgi:hypothetical protein
MHNTWSIVTDDPSRSQFRWGLAAAVAFAAVVGAGSFGLLFS